MPHPTRTLLSLCLWATLFLGTGLGIVLPKTAQAQLFGNSNQSEFRMISGKARETFMDKYAQCIGSPTNRSSGNYVAPQGYLGWYQISVYDAALAGLCKAPVNQAPHSPNAWAFCDFQGPLAKKFMLMHEYDLRYTERGWKAQRAVFDHVIDAYETELRRIKYFPPNETRNTDRNIIKPEILVGLMHLWGTNAVERLLKKQEVIDKNNSSAQGMAHCLEQCLTNPFVKDMKCS